MDAPITQDDRPIIEFPVVCKPTSLRDLVARANAIPPDRIWPVVYHLFRALERVQGEMSPGALRNLILLGALTNRLIFGINNVPTDPDFWV